MKDFTKSFGLKKPCANCPFRNDEKAIELAPGRREDIIEGLLSGKDSTFHCHKTVYRKGAENFDEDGNYTPNEVAQCPGALAVCKKFGVEPQMVQVMTRLGVIKDGHYDEALALTLDPKDLSADRSYPHLSRMQKTDSELEEEADAPRQRS